ncbi:SPW repeat protein [Streptacidiphilus sp. EB129]|uniref:SPW repeat domain-containing protein n=1 Tax=Streptacidiphilus sp. EB129 TaxID=3156262 RepID=UPI003514D8B2
MALVTSPRAGAAVSPVPRFITPPRPAWWADQRQALGYLLVVIGVWLFTTIWALDYPTTAQAQNAHLNEVMVGIVVVFNGMSRLLVYPSRVSDVVLLLSGVWLVAAPFAVGYTKTAEAGQAAVADWVTGGVLVLLALYSMFSLRISERLSQRLESRA